MWAQYSINQRFSDVFRGYRNVTLDSNGLSNNFVTLFFFQSGDQQPFLNMSHLRFHSNLKNFQPCNAFHLKLFDCKVVLNRDSWEIPLEELSFSKVDSIHPVTLLRRAYLLRACFWWFLLNCFRDPFHRAPTNGCFSLSP